MVLGGMRERGRGAIVNIGSGAATVIPSSPLLAGEHSLAAARAASVRLLL
jgi:NADP-dependent 3-hydroxy acid dehydrogenase YdfG